MGLFNRIRTLWDLSQHNIYTLTGLESANMQHIGELRKRAADSESRLKALEDKYHWLWATDEAVPAHGTIADLYLRTTVQNGKIESLCYSLDILTERFNRLQNRKSKEQVCHDILRSAGKEKDLRDVLPPLTAAVDLLRQLAEQEYAQ